MISIKKLEQTRAMNNTVVVDLGDSTGFVEDVGKIKLAYADEYSGYEYLRRSGKVLSVPKQFTYYKPFDPSKNATMLRERLRNVCVNVGDVVFWETETRALLESKGWTMKTDEGHLVYLIPYRLLILALSKDTQKVVMLNGKLIVERTKKKQTSPIISITDHDKHKNTWCKVVHANNNEGYEGVWQTDCTYSYWNSQGQDLLKGDYVLTKRYSTFDMQNFMKEYKDIDPDIEAFSVERHKIIAYKRSLDGESLPYGDYAKVELDKDHESNKDLYAMSETGLWLRKKKVSFKGKVVGTGSGFFGAVVGQDIYFHNKGEIAEIDGNHIFIRSEWIDENQTWVRDLPEFSGKDIEFC